MSDLTRGKSAEDRRLDQVFSFLAQWKPTVNVNLCVDGTAGGDPGEVLKAIEALGAKVDKLADKLDRVETELTELTDAGDGMALLLETLAGEIRNGANSEARMNALADKMDAKAKVWIEKTLANTPADPAAEDGPPPEDGPSFKRK